MAVMAIQVSKMVDQWPLWPKNPNAEPVFVERVRFKKANKKLVALLNTN